MESVFRQDKIIATGGDALPDSDFGCQALSTTSLGGSKRQFMSGKVEPLSADMRRNDGGRGLGAATMSDSERCGPVTHARGRSQGNPDHGSMY
jgi:hypothetical protein